MTDQELKDLVAGLAVAQAKTDEGLNKLKEAQAKTDEGLNKLKESQEKTDKKIDRIASLVGNISNNQGSITEEYFINSLEEQLRVGKVDFDYLVENFKAKKGHQILAEYDILFVNGKSVAIVEVKNKAHINDLDALPKKIEQLKNLPQYKNYNIYAGLATFYASDELIKKAKERGYFILQRKGDVIVNHTENLKAA